MATSATSTTRSGAANMPPPDELDDDLEDAAPPVKKKRGLLKMIFLLTLVGGAGGGAWYAFRKPDAGEEAPVKHARKAKSGKAKAASSEPPVFVALDPFTVNLQHDGSLPQYLQVGLSVRVDDEKYVGAMKLHMPEIRNRVLLLLSSKKASEISSLEGKKILSDELRKAIAQPVATQVPAGGVDSVLFTSFVIQ